MMNWATLYCDDRYQVSDTGLIRNKKTKRVLKATWSNNYFKVGIGSKTNNTKRLVKIHQAVVYSFIGKVNGLIVDHIDCDTTNNNLSNLRQITQEENIKRIY
jgi:hypothetical protein